MRHPAVGTVMIPVLSLFHKQQFVALYCVCLEFVLRTIAEQLLLLEGDFLSQSGISGMQHNLQEATEISDTAERTSSR